MNMQFLTANLANTTTSISLNTSTAGKLIDRTDSTFLAEFLTTTSATFTANFTINNDMTTVVLKGCNFKNFSISHSGTNFTLINADTTTSSWSANSATNLYLRFATITVGTLTLIVNSNTAGSLTHTCQQVWLMESLHVLEFNPRSNGYQPLVKRQQYNHKLVGGGWTQYLLEESYIDTNIKLDFVSEVERVALKNLYDRRREFSFIPFPTSTSWDNDIFEVIWTGDFKFDRYGRNEISEQYVYNGDMRLRETAKSKARDVSVSVYGMALYDEALYG